jgi:hypothetical protein
MMVVAGFVACMRAWTSGKQLDMHVHAANSALPARNSVLCDQPLLQATSMLPRVQVAGSSALDQEQLFHTA